MHIWIFLGISKKCDSPLSPISLYYIQINIYRYIFKFKLAVCNRGFCCCKIPEALLVGHIYSLPKLVTIYVVAMKVLVNKCLTQWVKPESRPKTLIDGSL